jgi:SAM-dependent methyltransferase
MTDYYEENAQSFIADTLPVDMSSIYEPFVEKLKGGASVLDIGCGSGRDLLFFKESGYMPTGLEPSPLLAKHAREYAQVNVIEQTIQNFEFEKCFDAIWACASLLHIPSNELLSSFTKISQLLTHEGIIYASFKYGDFEGIKNERFFNFQTIQSIKEYLPNSLEINEYWISSDKRKDRIDEWLNILISKSSTKK